MSIQYINISNLTKDDLCKFSVNDLVYVFLAAFQFPKYYSVNNLAHQTLLYQSFLNFVKGTKYSMGRQKFVDVCKDYWSLILLENEILVELPKVLPSFSYFSKPITNVKPYKNINLLQLFALIKSQKYYEKQTNELREISEQANHRVFKTTQFDYVTFSGVFEKRNSHSLLKHSGYLCIDIDHVQTNINELKTKFSIDKNLDVQLMFTSPSGKGLKLVVQFNNHQNTHIEVFEFLEKYFTRVYHLQIDKACKNVDRACFICYDSEIFINSKIYNQ